MCDAKSHMQYDFGGMPTVEEDMLLLIAVCLQLAALPMMLCEEPVHVGPMSMMGLLKHSMVAGCLRSARRRWSA